MRTRRHGWWLRVQGMGTGRVPHMAIPLNALTYKSLAGDAQ